jgi:hypothetical protein
MRLDQPTRPGYFLGVLLAIELGSLVRLLPIAMHGFPLNDGGLFYQMTEDLIANGLRLPLMTSYNGGGIPFAYPPLGFYLAASLQLATKAPLLELVRWLPGLFSILTIPAFYLLARRLLSSSELATIAVLTFALIPRSHEWLVMGGGLARSPGMLFSILSLIQADRLLERPTWKNALLLGLLLALVTVSHLEMAWYTLFSSLLFWVFRGRTRNSFGGVALALAAAAALSSFWWLPVVATHGVTPFVQAALTGQHTLSSSAAVLTNFTGEPFLGVFVLLGLLGAVVYIARRELLLPLWLFLTILLDPRAAGTDASAPLALLVAVAVTFVVLPPLVEPVRQPRTVQDQLASPASGMLAVPRRTRNMVVGALAAYGVYAALLAPFSPSSSIAVLRPGEVEAMDWIGVHLPRSAEFLVVSARTRWESDPLSEWFPALTHQVSLATPQGQEWTGGLAEAAERHQALQQCATRGLRCLEGWLAEGKTRFDYVLVATYPASSAIQTVALVQGLERSQDYELVFSNPDAAVFSRRSAESP